MNVSNENDRRTLLQRGVTAERVIVLPFGMNQQRREMFEKLPLVPPSGPAVVAFVGTYDYRKGATDFPKIVDHVIRAAPSTKFRLLGTKGLFPTAKSVLDSFPESLRPFVEVRPEFSPEELPELLRDAAVGVFPSYAEGFGFGVLEMLAAALPVIAYDAPGPPEMLPREWLVPPGDVTSMSRRLVGLLSDTEGLTAARASARLATAPFKWGTVAMATRDAYERALHHRRSAVASE